MKEYDLQSEPVEGVDVVREGTRRSMRSNRSQGTKPEIALRKALWLEGLRGYRKNLKGLPGTPDIVFTKAKIAIFMHGCFWHGCKLCRRNLVPTANSTYWSSKIEKNRQRDEKNRELLVQLGFDVLVFWECELKGQGLQTVVAKTKARVSDNARSPVN